MSAIGLTTLGMFDGPSYGGGTVTGGGGVIIKEEETIPKPNIFVKDVEFKKSLMVTAESVTVNKKKSSKTKRLNEENSAPEITASASVVAVKNSSKLTTLKEKFSKKH